MAVLLSNARIFDGERFHEDSCLLIRDGRIAGIHTADDIPEADEIHDLAGDILAPGFVDVQVNGGGGVMFNNSPTVEGLSTIARAHARYGTTSLIPTLISDSWAVMEKAADAVSLAMANHMPGIRGVHFEGPYLNRERKGVHSPDAIREVDGQALEILGRTDLGSVVTTLAPECVPGSYIRDLQEAGVKVCAGHTAATYEQIVEAISQGLCGFTHLYNAMSPLTGRGPGTVGAAIEDPGSWCGIIADSYHVHDASLKIAIRAKPRGKILLVTDAMATVGAEDKRFELYGETIRAEGGRCATGDGTLAGSDLDMAGAVRHTHRRLDQPLEEALRMASLYPAEFLGLDKAIGRIAPGYDADLVRLNNRMEAAGTWIGGKSQF